MSGVPGSGKSTYVKHICENITDTYHVCSADDFRIVDGQYVFDREKEKAGLPHKLCLMKYLDIFSNWRHCLQKCDVIVDNTNTTALEISPYYSIASAYSLPVKIITVIGDVEECIRRNVHSVPARTIKDMAERIERRKFPDYWNFENLVLTQDDLCKIYKEKDIKNIIE
jgi:predicted kinase